MFILQVAVQLIFIVGYMLSFGLAASLTCLSLLPLCLRLWVDGVMCIGVMQAKRMSLKQAFACEKQFEPEYQSALDAYDKVACPPHFKRMPPRQGAGL